MDDLTTAPAPPRPPFTGTGWNWMDGLWLVFLLGLALLPPVREWHKQLILLGLALAQIFEGRLVAARPRSGAAITVLLKIFLSWLLIAHTADIAINSRYYPIFFVPVITAAIYFGPRATVLFTTLASAVYCSYLIPALHDFLFTRETFDELALRVSFLFLAALVINRIALEKNRQRDLYRQAAESLEIANRNLLHAQASARRAERLAALGQLSAGLAHEIRNPLGVIKGSAEMLQTSLAASNPVAVELAGYISTEVNRVNLLVTRFLDFARPLQLQRQTVALASLLARALDESLAEHPNTTVKIERAWDSHLPDVNLDPDLCDRVFVNLAGNALEAMDSMEAIEGAPHATLRVTAHAIPGAVQILFADNGPGVPPDLREQIFNPFFTTKKAGVGLGLAIVAKIMDQHGGAIRLLDSPTGAGFELTFPTA